MVNYDLGKVVGATGAAGKGITSITKTGASGFVDTYTIQYSDGTSSTFTVTNGANCENQWVRINLNANVALYVNTTLRLCELKFNRTFNRAAAYADYTWYTDLIPPEFLPNGNAYGRMNNSGTLWVFADGTIGGSFDRALETQFTAMGNVMWSYGFKIIPESWYNYNNLTVTEVNDEIHLSNSESDWAGYFANKPGTSETSLSHIIDWDSPFRVEVDIVSYTGTVYLHTWDQVNLLQKTFITGLGVTNGSHIILTSDGETVTWEVDGNVVITDNVALGQSRIGFRLNPNATLAFKNFTIEQ